MMIVENICLKLEDSQRQTVIVKANSLDFCGNLCVKRNRQTNGQMRIKAALDSINKR